MIDDIMYRKMKCFFLNCCQRDLRENITVINNNGHKLSVVACDRVALTSKEWANHQRNVYLKPRLKYP